MQKYKGKLNDLLNKKENVKIPQRELERLGEDQFKQTKSLKFDNKNSTVAKPQAARVNIEEAVKDIINDQKEMANLTATLTQNIVKAILDKTLKENKTTTDKDNENNVIGDYVKLARVVNKDHSQEEGLGNLSFIYAVCKCLFVLRDRVNELEYNNSVQSKLIDKLNFQIQALIDKK